MSIVSTSVIEEPVQKDGRRYVRERHTDELGEVHEVSYLAESGGNALTVAQGRAALIDNQIKELEFQNCLAAIMREATPRLRHLTLAEVGPLIRAWYATTAGEECAKVSAYLLTLTDAQLRTIFGVTATQLTTLKNRLTTRRNAWTTLQSQVGE